MPCYTNKKMPNNGIGRIDRTNAAAAKAESFPTPFAKDIHTHGVPAFAMSTSWIIPTVDISFRRLDYA